MKAAVLTAPYEITLRSGECLKFRGHRTFYLRFCKLVSAALICWHSVEGIKPCNIPESWGTSV